MGMVAGSMGTLRPLFSKLVGGITSRSSGTGTSSGERADGPAYKLFTRSKRRVRGAASRVQGDSVLVTTNSVIGSVALNTRVEEDDATFRTLVEVPPLASKKQPRVGNCDLDVSQAEITASSNHPH